MSDAINKAANMDEWWEATKKATIAKMDASREARDKQDYFWAEMYRKEARAIFFALPPKHLRTPGMVRDWEKCAEYRQAAFKVRCCLTRANRDLRRVYKMGFVPQRPTNLRGQLAAARREINEAIALLDDCKTRRKA